jgi:Lrp/AsnC family transcriptional regulator, leucine-responsive regulatory protein
VHSYRERQGAMLDSFDLKILDAWQDQGDIGPVEMSQRVNLSASQCSRRMQQLRKSGHVAGTYAVLDHEKLGIGVAAYVLITMKTHSPEATANFYERMNALDEVIECQRLTGIADVILKVRTRDLQSFNRLLTRELLAAPEVQTSQSSIVLEDIKSTRRLPMRFASGAA